MIRTTATAATLLILAAAAWRAEASSCAVEARKPYGGPPPGATHGADPATGVGGGAGYANAPDPQRHPDRITRRNRAGQERGNAELLAELMARLKAAEPDATVFIAGDVEINLAGLNQGAEGGVQSLEVRPGVTLASDRGRNGSRGARLYLPYPEVREQAQPVLFLHAGSRLTGLRVEGPVGEPSRITEPAAGLANSVGVRTLLGSSNVEIDNNEISGWGAEALSLARTAGAKVHHNHIHHNQSFKINPGPPDPASDPDYLPGPGYGVVLKGLSTAVIHANLFSHNRHAVAGLGSTGQGFEAYDNLVLYNVSGPAFIMRGAMEARSDVFSRSTCEARGDCEAGGYLNVHHNTVLSAGWDGVRVHGRPGECANVAFNAFAQPREAGEGVPRAALQVFSAGNFTLGANDYGVDDFAAFDGGDGPGVFWATPARDWRLFSFRKPGWKNLLDGPAPRGAVGLALGDFDGDGRTDLFFVDAGPGTAANGRYYRLEDGHYRATGGLDLASGGPDFASGGLAGLAFGDFSGDGRADVVRQPRVAGAGTQKTEADGQSASAGTQKADGDTQKTGAGQQKNSAGMLQVARDALAPWVALDLPVDAAPVYADFSDDFTPGRHAVPDGRTDVLSGGGTEPRVSWGSGGGFRDFDGDGHADRFAADGARWTITYSGPAPARREVPSPYREGALAFGAFGDGPRGASRVFAVEGADGEKTGGGTQDGGDGSTGDEADAEPEHGRWLVADVGRGAGALNWTPLNNYVSPSFPVDRLRFADFDGDGVTDVFAVSEGSGEAGQHEWLISWGGATPWNTVNAQPYGLDRLRLADLNGDAQADVVITLDDGSRRVSWGAIQHPVPVEERFRLGRRR